MGGHKHNSRGSRSIYFASTILRDLSGPATLQGKNKAVKTTIIASGGARHCINLDLSVPYNSTDLLNQIISALKALTVSWKDKGHVHQAVEELSKIDSNADNRIAAEKNIEHITYAAKELRKVSADVSLIRLKFDELLKIWQKKWTTLPEKEHDHWKDKKHSWLDRFKLSYNTDARRDDRQIGGVRLWIL